MGSLAASVALPAYAIVKGMEAAEESDKRAKRQHMYTDDLDVTGNKVTVSSTDDDDDDD